MLVAQAPTSCSSTRRTPTGSTCRPTPRRRAAPPGRRAARCATRPTPRRSTGVYAPAGMLTADPDAGARQRRATRSSPTSWPRTRPGGSSARSPASTTSGPSATRRAAPACGAWRSTRSRRSGASGEALTRALAEQLPRPRPGLRRPLVLHDNRRRHPALREARLRARAGAVGQAQERHQRAAVRRPASPGLPAAQPLRPDHRRRGAAAAGSTSRCSTPSGASCG